MLIIVNLFGVFANLLFCINKKNICSVFFTKKPIKVETLETLEKIRFGLFVLFHHYYLKNH